MKPKNLHKINNNGHKWQNKESIKSPNQASTKSKPWSGQYFFTFFLNYNSTNTSAAPIKKLSICMKNFDWNIWKIQLTLIWKNVFNFTLMLVKKILWWKADKLGLKEFRILLCPSPKWPKLSKIAKNGPNSYFTPCKYLINN